MKQTCSDQLTDELVTATEKTTTNQLERSAQLRTRATKTAASIGPNHMTVSLQLQYDFDYKTAVNNVLSKHSTKLFARNPVVCFLEVDKTCVDAFGILPKFLEILLER